MSDLRREGRELATIVVDRLVAEVDGADGARSVVARTLDGYADLFERTFEAYADAIGRVFSADGAVKLEGPPGREAAGQVWVHNATDGRVVTGALRITDLRGADGARIDAASAAFAPTALVVPPGASASSTLEVRIPPSAAAGAYHGHVFVGDQRAASLPVRLVVQ